MLPPVRKALTLMHQPTHTKATLVKLRRSFMGTGVDRNSFSSFIKRTSLLLSGQHTKAGDLIHFYYNKKFLTEQDGIIEKIKFQNLLQQYVKLEK